MNEVLKILHLEDRTTDAELVERELLKGGLKFELKWAKDKEEYINALKDFSADIILSDHSLPTLNSIAALELMKAAKIEIPFILITSNTSEEIAAAVMKAGAWDYILKDRMQRLPNAVKSAVEKHRYEKERQEYLGKIIEYHDRYDIVSKATNDAIWDWDIKQNTILWNHGVQTIFGYAELFTNNSEEEWKERIHPLDFQRVIHEMKDAFAEHKNNWISNYRYRCANGNYKHVLDRAYIIYDAGNATRMIGAMQDVTELTQYREGLEKMVEERTHELKEALNKEKLLVEMKSNFVSVASHEFRTPLTSISLASGFVKKYFDKVSPEKLKEKIENIEHHVAHMVQLLDDILLIGKTESGKVTAHFVELEMNFFEKLARELMSNNVSSHQLRFSCRSNQTKIVTDERLLRQIIANLLTNAVKFSPGASEVAMKVVCSEKNLLISIKDFGIGILPEELKNLFTPFSRASNAVAIEGTGLGLSIVKTSVELLKGKIMVNSLPGHGTTFKVVIPLERLPEYPDKPSVINEVSKLES